MDDLISRQAAIAIADSSDYVGLSVDDVKKVTDEVIKGLKQLPSTQPEIIRCRDCVYSHMTYSGECKYCDKWGEMYEAGESLYLEGDFFCGFGERKTDG